MNKLTKEKLKPAFKTSYAKLNNFFEQNTEWIKFLYNEIDFVIYESLRTEFLTWKKENDKKSTGRPKGIKEAKKRQVREGFKVGRPRKIDIDK